MFFRSSWLPPLVIFHSLTNHKRKVQKSFKKANQLDLLYEKNSITFNWLILVSNSLLKGKVISKWNLSVDSYSIYNRYLRNPHLKHHCFLLKNDLKEQLTSKGKGSLPLECYVRMRNIIGYVLTQGLISCGC